MEYIIQLFKVAPLLALFITLALGYLVGKLKIGSFQLGGIAGTLLVGVVIGQLNVDIDSGIKSIFFALFIYAVGYQGGPQFFQSLNLRTLNLLASSFLMTFTGLLCVLGAALLFNLDRGTAAGLAAGGLTQSAIIGTAGNAIANLNVSASLKHIMETNVAVGYAVTYIFGSLGPIIMATWFFPTLMKWNIKDEATKLARKMTGGSARLEPGQFNAIRRVVTRAFEVSANSKMVGKTTLIIDEELSDVAVEAIVREGKSLDLSNETVVRVGDELVLTGIIEVMEKAGSYFGPEVTLPRDFQFVEENREIILTKKSLIGKELQQIHDEVSVDLRHGVFLTGVKRMGRELPVAAKLVLHRGDEIQLTGSQSDLNRVQSRIGYKITAAAVTDFIFFGIGMSVGLLIGLISFKIADIPVNIGSGAGCLISGLFFGWLRSVHPHFAALPTGASNFLRDFGLAVFVGLVGLMAGPQAIVMIKEYGFTLLLLGVGVTLIPQIITFYISYYLLRIKNPIEILGAMVGGRSANPGFAALLEKAGNATPVVSFTVTYAVANVFLTLWGPVIIGIITKNPTP